MPLIDILLLIILAAVTWCVAGEGAWGAAIMLFSVIFSGLLAMNFFEPLANALEGAVPDWRTYWDVIALIGLFVGFVFLFRTVMEQLMPTFVQVQTLAYEGVRWTCGLLAGYVTMAFLLTALHTAPLPREFIGFTPERANLFGMAAPDRQWLGFTQYASERVFARGRIFDGPRFTVGDQQNDTWPSFPIRYASRRESLGAPPVAPAPSTAPRPRTRSGPGF